MFWSNGSERNPILPFYLISRKIGFFSEPFDQNKKVMTFLMQNRPMAQRDLTRPPKQMVKFWYNVGVSDLKMFFFQKMPIYFTKILAISLQKWYQNFTKNFLVKHPIQAIKWGVARKTLSWTQLCSASEFILFIYIGLRWALSNKIRAHIGATFVFQGETDFVKCRAQVCLSGQKLHHFSLYV